MAETIRVAELATLVSNDVFKFFKWNRCLDNDSNFDCSMPTEHFAEKDKSKKTETGKKSKEITEDSKKTHPTDVVFYYLDPYLNKKVYFNTDLKSYGAKSINYSAVKDWLTSLINGTECARGSTEWQQRYSVDGEYEIRGMLFVYNHDGEFNKSIYQYIHEYEHDEPVVADGKRTSPKFHITDLNIPLNLKAHIVEPKLISYMQSIKSDCIDLFSQKKIPEPSKLNFFYPNRQLNKASLTAKECPASIELISGPFLIISFEEFNTYTDNEHDPDSPIKTINTRGNVVYYRENGDTPEEFIYLLEALMVFELINDNSSLLIRHISEKPSTNASQNFQSAIDQYCKIWHYSTGMQEVLNKIEFDPVTIVQRVFLTKQINRKKEKA